jgi:hypothetical protein
LFEPVLYRKILILHIWKPEDSEHAEEQSDVPAAAEESDVAIPNIGK